MANNIVSKKTAQPIEWELYFLIERFLANGPCKSAANVLRRELVEQGLLPGRLDWNGQDHERSYESLLEINRHIGGDHLLKICRRLGPLLDEKIPPYVTGVGSLLGAGRQSLLRTDQDIKKTLWQAKNHIVVQHGRSKYPPQNLVVPSWMFVHRGEEMSGQTHYNHVVPVCMYNRMQRLSRKLGHLSAVYCVLFDRTGEYVFTGADDSLVKIWWVKDSRLKATLRGHGAEITDMAINYENTLLASGSCDRTIRIWCVKSKSPVSVLQAHTGMITSLQFSPMVHGNKRYLASTGGDACVCFWEWSIKDNSFNLRPIKYIEKSRAGAQVLCSSFSPGGMFYAAGSTDNVIRMYHFLGGFPEKIGELEKHTDRVDSICYAYTDNRFLSGSKDGTARIWKFERNEWRNIVLDMALKLPIKQGDGDKKPQPGTSDDERKVPPKLRVTMVGWNNNDSRVFTAVNDNTIKVWCSFSGTLIHELRGHEDEVFVLEACNKDKRILLSAGHDGNIIIWNIEKGTQVKQFFNQIQGQGHGAVFDCKMSQDGASIIATDSHGHMMIYGHGSVDKYDKLPNALFFHTDYRPLVRDTNNYVLDEQTQQVPHLMPPPFLVDIEGNPYPPALQRLVPGREACKDEQLIPEFTVNEEGQQEVVGDRVPEHPEEMELEPDLESESDMQASSVASGILPAVRPSIDQMIERLQRQLDQQTASVGGPSPITSPSNHPSTSPNPRAGISRSNSVAGPGHSSSHMVGMRRTGELEGVRQSLGNILQVSTSKDLVAIRRRIVVKDMDPAVLRQNEDGRQALAEQEIKQYNIERRKKNLVVSRDSSEEQCEPGILTRKKKKTKRSYKTTAPINEDDAATNRLTRRALYDTDESMELNELDSDIDEEDEDNLDLVLKDSSDYSDWCVDTSSNLQPPKRKSNRIKKRKRYSSSEEDDVMVVESDDTVGTQNSNNSQPRGSQSRGKGKKLSDAQSSTKSDKGKKLQKKSSREAAALPGKTPEEMQELLTRFRPPEWLTDVIPRKSPYFPQMGDELMYFRQGHELYVKAVDTRKVYPIDPNKNQAWHRYPKLRETEMVRIVGIRYELLKTCGVRLCCLKLNYIDAATLKNTGGSFSIKYHDMPDVVDFLVLKQNYDIAKKRKWKPGDRFQSMIDDSWWMGIIENQVPFQKEYADSLFQCFRVRWDNAEREHLSPWDLEPYAENRKEVKRGSMHVKIKRFVESCSRLFYHYSKKDSRFTTPAKRSTMVSELYSNAKDTDNFVLLHSSPEYRGCPVLSPACSRHSNCPKLIRLGSNISLKLASTIRITDSQQTCSRSISGQRSSTSSISGQRSSTSSISGHRSSSPIARGSSNSISSNGSSNSFLSPRKRRSSSIRNSARLQQDTNTESSPRSQRSASRRESTRSDSEHSSSTKRNICSQRSPKRRETEKRRRRLPDNEETRAMARWKKTKEFFTKKCPPSVIGGGVLVTPEELNALLYKSRPSEWPSGDIDQDCDRIVCGWEQVMGHSIAEPFLTPVDLSAFHSYAMTIEYPMDLNTIKRRLENRFYRRVTALQFDLRYIESNTKTFNEPKSQIVKSAQVLCDSLLKFIGDVGCEDPCQIINKRVRGRKIKWSIGSGASSDTEDNGPGTSSHSGKHGDKGKASTLNPHGWKKECKTLISTIIECEDSEPFRAPVNIDQYPDYYHVIENPMDLRIVNEKLHTDEYTAPTQIAKDMSTIFYNSKFYNTNKRSRIYTMTLRLSAMFESRMKDILAHWKQANKDKKQLVHNGKSVPHGRHNGASSSRVAGSSRLTNGRRHDSDSGSDASDSDDDVRTPRDKPQRSKSGRLLRARWPTRRIMGYDSDGDNPTFPEPKPDYTDDDYEIDDSPPKKASPKKRGGKHPVESDYADATRYSTRAQTGTIQTRKYTNDEFFSDEDDNESVISETRKPTSAKSNRSHSVKSSKKLGPVAQESSGSDTEIESLPATSSSINSRHKYGKTYNEDSDDTEHTTDSEEVTQVKRGRGKRPVRSKLGAAKKKIVRRNGKLTNSVRNKRKTFDSEDNFSQSTGTSVSSSSGVEHEEEELCDEETETEEDEVTRPRTKQAKQSSSDTDFEPPPRKRVCTQTKSFDSARSGSRTTRRTRNRGVKYTEDSANSESDAEVTVSRHGRVRKPTARARAMLY